jgi:hypothetical protein
VGETFDTFALTVLPTLYVLGVFTFGVRPEGRKQYFSFATVVAVINSVVGGSAVAIALGAFADASLAVAAGVGGAAAAASLFALLRLADRMLADRAGEIPALFPSPPGTVRT